MSTDTDYKDRISKLEARLEENSKKLDSMSGKVDELHDLLLQVKGAKYILWVILALASVIGFKSIDGFYQRLFH